MNLIKKFVCVRENVQLSKAKKVGSFHNSLEYEECMSQYNKSLETLNHVINNNIVKFNKPSIILNSLLLRRKARKNKQPIKYYNTYLFIYNGEKWGMNIDYDIANREYIINLKQYINAKDTIILSTNISYSEDTKKLSFRNSSYNTINKDNELTTFTFDFDKRRNKKYHKNNKSLIRELNRY